MREKRQAGCFKYLAVWGERWGKALYQHCLISECIKCAVLAPLGRLQRPGAALCPPMLLQRGYS